MKYFYGVYLKSGEISTALDLVRYISEPDTIRFSHVTLRGPYRKPLPSSSLKQIVGDKSDWKIRLSGPGKFFNAMQSTVIIRVDLLDLQEVFFKPDFQDGLAHITLYDGNDRGYAESLLQLLYKYDFQQVIEVTTLKRLSAKMPTGGNFIALYDDFYNTYCECAGHRVSACYAKALNNKEKLKLVDVILSKSFSQHYSKLRPSGANKSNDNLEFNFGDDNVIS